jgi:TRAP-type C4-dicarboxylate transport system substrate-binding protein
MKGIEVINRRFLPFSILLIWALVITGTAFAQAEPKILFKMATIAPRGSFMMSLINEMDAEIRKATNNEVGIKIYYGGVQGESAWVSFTAAPLPAMAWLRSHRK